MSSQKVFKRDTENERLCKLPRKSMWNRSIGGTIVHCPECGKYSNASAHCCRNDGELSPSFVCGNKACTYHEFITLENAGLPIIQGDAS